MRFASAIDRHYVLPYSAMLHSFRARNRGASALAHVLHYDLVDDDFEYLRRVSAEIDVPIDFIRIPEYPFQMFTVRKRQNMNASGSMSPIAYAKAFIDRFLPPEAADVICIDADIIVTDDIGGLPVCNGGAPLLAVANLPRNHHHQFNSGLMVIDLDRWRRLRVADIAERFLSEYSEALHTHDQHTLNLIFRNHWQRIDLKWNYMEDFHRFAHKSRTYSAEEIREARLSPAIVHFAVGSDKPWHKKSEHPRAQLYLEAIASLARFRDGLSLFDPGEE